MKQEGRGKKITALLLALLMMVSTAFCTEVPVSAASIRSDRITAKIERSSSSSIRFSWNKSSKADGYIILRRASVKHKYKKIKTVGKNVTSYTDKGLPYGKAYQYAVRAYRKEGRRNIYSVYKAATGATCPSTPSPRVKTVSENRINVYWNQVSRADGYRIYRRIPGQKWVFVADVAKTKRVYADKTVQPGTNYVYCVRSYKKSSGKKYMSAIRSSKKIKTPGNPYVSHSKFTAAQKDAMKKILYAVETGGQVYGNQDYADFTEAYTNSSAEHAITIGAGQWYATEAQRLLKLIHTKYPEVWKKYDSDGRVWKDVESRNWSTYKLSKNHYKAKRIVNIIKSKEGIKCQDELMYQQIEEMENEIRALGITDARSVGMFINIRHQGGYGAVTRVLGKTKRPVSLDNIYKALQTDTGNQVGAYRTRQKKVYTWLRTYM